MKILVTGSKGFVGRNLIAELKNQGYKDIFEYNRNTDKALLSKYTKDCDFVFHLAGVNRPKDESEFMEGNFAFTSELLDLLKKHNNKAPVLITSSIQAERDNPYGISKKASEDSLFNYSQETGGEVYIYRLPNLFGKWSRPNYNTVVATFCHNIARDLDIQINDPDLELSLCYIDDVVSEFIRVLKNYYTKKFLDDAAITSEDLGKTDQQKLIEESFYYMPVTYKINLRKLADTIINFKESRLNLKVPNMEDELTKKLYSTYLSFLPTDRFSYNLKMNCDNRGSFTEFIRTPDRGQISINISKPGVAKGNHWHHSKNEKFVVVSGKGVIRFRKIDSDEVLEYLVNGDKMEVVDIPTGYTHNIENLGESDMVTIMWANEPFDPEKPDTYFLEV